VCLHENLNPEKYLRLAPGVSIKALESAFLYDIRSDELYEINEEGVDFLIECDGSIKAGEMCFDDEFIEYCLGENLLEALDAPSPRMVNVYRSPIPSLRYLEIQITHRCNRACRHCYLGSANAVDLSAEDVVGAMSQFEAMGGLRVMISGGEPLLHPQWDRINAELNRFELRSVLLTNGELITREVAERLAAQEVQVSLDGMEKGHDFLRGAGSWSKAMRGVETVISAGLDLSVATMVHKGNIAEFDEMDAFFREIGVREWGIDVPCVSGRLESNSDILLPVDQAAPLLKYAFGGSYHGGGEGYACGLHLATLTPDGNLLKCGFYANEPLGILKEGLKKAWKRANPIPLKETECRACEHVPECAGGCRYRAPSPTEPDPVMCALYGK